MAAADGPNSTAGMPASRNEIASDAPSRPTRQRLALDRALTASRSASTYGLLRETIAGARLNERTISRSPIARIWARISPGSWPGQVADVDVHPAAVRDLVEGVAADDPREVDRRAVEEVRGLAAERQRLDPAEDVVRLEDRVVAEPRRRAVCGEAADLDADREHALGLDADVQVGRLAGDREVGAAEPLATSASVERSSTSSDSSSGTQTKRTRTASCAAASWTAHIIAASAPFMS